MDWLPTLLQSLGIAGLVAWLVKSLLKHWMSSDLEKYKANLAAKNTEEAEQLKSDLRKIAFEHETRFAKLHERRAELIAELYGMLYRAKADFNLLTSPFGFMSDPSKTEQFETAVNSFNNFANRYWPARIYLADSLCDDIENIINALKDVYGVWTREVRAETQRGAERKDDHWGKADKIMKNDVPPIFTKIESSFRQILGIDAAALE